MLTHTYRGVKNRQRSNFDTISRNKKWQNYVINLRIKRLPLTPMGM